MTELQTLSTRQLNRALLARQHLLERSAFTLTQVIEDVGGLQTQYAPSGYIALWTRMANLERAALTRAMEARDVLHGTLMRVTIHSVTAADYWPMAIGVRRARRDWFNRVNGRRWSDAQNVAAAQAAREILSDGPLRLPEIRKRIAARGFDPIPPGSLGVWLDTVRVPPSGTWERRSNDPYALAEQWLPPERVHPDGLPTEEDGIRLLLTRYLGGFAPARPSDFADWAAIPLKRVQPIIATTELRKFRDEAGHELIDFPGSPLPDPDTPAPVRFLPTFDPTLLVNCRRTQILPEEYRPRIFNVRTPSSIGTILVDGQVAGTWKIEAGNVGTQTFVTLAPQVQRELETEAEALSEFHS